MINNMDKRTAGILAGIASALCVCGYITVNKFVYTHYDINALDYSLFFACIGGAFGILSILRQLNKKVATELKNNAPALITLGCAAFLAVGMFVFGQHYTTSVNAALLMTSSIVATSLFSYLLLGDRFRKMQWLWIFILFFGLYIGIVGINSISLQAGDVVILGSALFFGFGNAFSRVVMKKMKEPGLVPDVRLTIAGIIAGIVGIFVIRDYEVLFTIFPLAMLAGIFYWICMKMFAKAVHLLNANEAIVLNNSQIFFTSIAGVLLLSEGYSIEKFVGAVIVIASVYFITIHKSKRSVVA